MSGSWKDILDAALFVLGFAGAMLCVGWMLAKGDARGDASRRGVAPPACLPGSIPGTPPTRNGEEVSKKVSLHDLEDMLSDYYVPPPVRILPNGEIAPAGGAK